MSSLQNSPADIVRWLMIANGWGSDPTILDGSGNPTGAWPIYAGAEPSSPDNVITLYDTAPTMEGRIQYTGEQVHHWGIQARVRATDYTTGWAMAQLIHDRWSQSLHTQYVTIGSTQYCVHSVSGSRIQSLGKDAPSTKRSLFTVNATVMLVSVS